MPRYYFDITINDLTKTDNEGIDLVHEQAARREAVLTIAEIAAEEIPRDGSLLITINVRTESDLALFRTSVHFEYGEPR
nr:hypothetical protein [uncultured Devosia sp.]